MRLSISSSSRVRSSSAESRLPMSSSCVVTPVAFSVTCSSVLPSGVSFALRVVSAVSIALIALPRGGVWWGAGGGRSRVKVGFLWGLLFFGGGAPPHGGGREARARVFWAFHIGGLESPPYRITVNLSPADVRKAGAAFDLPIALGILAATGVVERRQIADRVVLGELSLDGSIQMTRGVLPIAAAARRDGLAGILLPAGN